MRFKNLLFGDMKFQRKYGFYLLYGILTAFYVVLLFCMPQSWKENAAALLNYSDPAAMGLFFMGAIILLEKSQRVISFFAVSPIRVGEYVCSKVLSLSMIALFVAAVLATVANDRRKGIFRNGIDSYRDFDCHSILEYRLPKKC